MAIDPRAIEAARRIVEIDDAYQNNKINGSSYSQNMTGYLNGKMVTALARAFLAAVEECAKVADDYTPPQPSASEFAKGATFTARNIAIAIRALTPSQEAEHG